MIIYLPFLWRDTAQCDILHKIWCVLFGTSELINERMSWLWNDCLKNCSGRWSQSNLITSKKSRATNAPLGCACCPELSIVGKAEMFVGETSVITKLDPVMVGKEPIWPLASVTLDTFWALGGVVCNGISLQIQQRAEDSTLINSVKGPGVESFEY